MNTKYLCACLKRYHAHLSLNKASTQVKSENIDNIYGFMIKYTVVVKGLMIK